MASEKAAFWVSTQHHGNLHLYEDCVRKYRRPATDAECMTMDVCTTCEQRRDAAKRSEVKKENIAARRAILFAMPPAESGNRKKVPTTVYLEAEQVVRLRERALSCGDTVAELIRKSIDAFLEAEHGK